MAEHGILRAENAALRDRVRLLEQQLAQHPPAAGSNPASVLEATRASRPVQSEAAEAHHNGNAYRAGDSAQRAVLAASDCAFRPPVDAPSSAAGELASREQQGGNGAAAGGCRRGGTPQASVPLQWRSAPHGLSQEQVGRYSRQLMLPSFGVEGAPPPSGLSG